MVGQDRPKLDAPSALGRTWDLEEDGELTLGIVGAAVVAATESWSGRLVDWSWKLIVQQSHEAFALLTDGEPKAIWASGPRRLLELPEQGRSYRLDFLEVAPECRGGVVAYYTAAIAAARALEAGAQSIVLASLPGAALFWKDVVGAQPGRIRGWQVPSTLLPYVITSSVMEELRSDADARQKA